VRSVFSASVASAGHQNVCDKSRTTLFCLAYER
jgi:hypothetical protein